MNLFDYYKNFIIKIVETNKKILKIDDTNNYQGVLVEIPPEKFDYELSCNISLVLGKVNKINPTQLANNIKEVLIKRSNDFKEIQVVNPGFLNIKLNDKTLSDLILNILNKKDKYGSNITKKKNYNIEFVSANPTGPLHIGHCRGAIFGDVLSNLLEFNGNKVIKEYYINDYGNQIINFTKSVFLRIREIKFNEEFVNEKDLYPGTYIIEIAKKIIKDNPEIKYDNFEKIFEVISEKSLEISMEMIKSDLDKLGVEHNNFFSEKNLVKKKLVEKIVKDLKNKKVIDYGTLPPPKGTDKKDWKPIKRLIFKSTNYGDDNDRALQKNDGSWTYFANDVAYHADKINRNYDTLINVLGADHTGYIKRITAAVKAISDNKVNINCKVTQLVKLYKNGQPFKMSKRAGDFVSVSDLLNEVSKDSLRFMMLNRSNDVEIDFDLNKVLEKTKDNPVFYVQYCYARINSLFRLLDIKEANKISIDVNNFFLNEYDKKLLKKIINWPKVVDASTKTYEIHRIPFYLYELATIFHSYWSKGNENNDYKFIQNEKIRNLNVLAILKLVNLVIKNGMGILGVSLPKKM